MRTSSTCIPDRLNMYSMCRCILLCLCCCFFVNFESLLENRVLAMRRDPFLSARPRGYDPTKRLGSASEQGSTVQVLLPSNTAGDTSTGYLRVDPRVFHSGSSLRAATVNGVTATSLLPSNRGGLTPQWVASAPCLHSACGKQACALRPLIAGLPPDARLPCTL